MKKPSAKQSREINRLLDRTWHELELKFQSAAAVAPRSGFAGRWRELWGQAERRQERLRNHWVVAANGFAALLFLAVCTVIGGNLLAQQASVISALVSSLLAFAVFVLTILNVTLSIIADFPLGAWVLFAAICAGLLALWAKVFRYAQMTKE